jgi:hypothetical protein
VKNTYFGRMKYLNGQVHYREVCRKCGGHVRGGNQNVGARELRAKGIDLESLPDLPSDEAAPFESSAPSGLRQRGLFDDLP